MFAIKGNLCSLSSTHLCYRLTGNRSNKISRNIPFIDILFQWSSALGTCGFCSVSVESWAGGAKLLMILAMLIGRAAGSTVGGIKLSRFVTIFKAVIWRFRRIALLPHEMMRYKLDGDSL